MSLRKLILAAAVGSTVLASTAAFAVEPPTFEEFAADTYVDPAGVYVVNGDEPVDTYGELRQFYDDLVSPPKAKKTDENSLIINAVKGGQMDKWSAAQALDLTYCVSTAFGGDHGRIVTAMAGGAQLWENASSGVDFVYVPSQDGNCNTGNRNVVFSVEPVQTSQYIARAFFPSTPKKSRNILVDDSIWSAGSWSPSNILGHELGHTLGFRHEHTRPESGTCFENNKWIPLTPYDSASIMHYPQCNGTSNNLSFTQTDAQGVRVVYGP